MNATRDTQGTQPERRSMHPDVERLLDAVLAGQDRMVELQSAVQDLPGHVGASVHEAIRRSAADPDVWAAAGSALRRHARDQAGGFLLGGLKATAVKVGWLLVIVGGVYIVGGWAAIAALWKSAFASQS